jgi:EAL domain-containing protein (putative c-di-GMP-specific phosphodiesterase class I)
LSEISRVFNSVLKDGQIYCREHSDNFLVLFRYKYENEALITMANSISRSIEDLKIWRELNLKPVISTGIYFVEEGDNDIRSAIDKAMLAKKEIKGKYKSSYSVYNKNMLVKLIEIKKIEDEMYDALTLKKFKVYFQPKYSLPDSRISGAEALVRWNHPKLGLISPDKFIQVFEDNGFITDLDKFVYEQVCISLRSWLDNGYKVLPVSVNVSRVHFMNERFASEYINIKDKYKIPDGLIEIEITESVIMENPDNAFLLLNEFRENGFKISIDDFGSGYSNLCLLRKIPIDTLKLDKMLLSNIEDYNSQVIVNNVVDLAKNLRLNVVSEGVETKTQVDFLKNIGCNMVQGYIFARPMPMNEYEKLIIEN